MNDPFPRLWNDLPADQVLPALHVHRAKNPTGTCIVLLPGGGYSWHAVEKEGAPFAEWLNAHGVTAIVTLYRLSPSRHPVPLGDALRAIRWARHHASQLNVDPAKIGIMGFSAGGHLAASAATMHDHGNPESCDPIERHSSRPDFAILAYPVIALDGPFVHAGSRNNLLGAEPPADLLREMSPNLRVNADTPPTFLFHTLNDISVPPENAILFWQALRAAGVAAELHLFEQGGHGVGFAEPFESTRNWRSLVISWMRSRKLLPPSEPAR